MWKNCSWNPSTCICENSMYLKGVADASVTEWDGIVMDNLLTKKTYTIATNVAKTASINCHSKKIQDCYILHTVLIYFFSDFTIDNYYYLLSLCKNKNALYKMENNEFKKFRVKNRKCYYFDDITK